MPKSAVTEYKFNYFENGAFPNQNTKNYPLFRIAVNGGFSYHTAKIHKSVPYRFRDYARELKSGYHLGGDITYYLSEQLGIGLKYCQFMTSNSLDNIAAPSVDGTVRYGTISDDLRIIFIGPALSSRLLNQPNRNALIANLSIGYMNYSDKQVVIDPQKVTGHALGLAFDVGYDIGLSKNLLLGLQISFISGVLKKFKLQDSRRTTTVILQRGDYESMHRLDFSIGLRFSK